MELYISQIKELHEQLFEEVVNVGNSMQEFRKQTKLHKSKISDTSKITDPVEQEYANKSNAIYESQIVMAENITQQLFDKLGFQISSEQDSHNNTQYRLREAIGVPGVFVSKAQAYERVIGPLLPKK
jgi:hypothetical protein